MKDKGRGGSLLHITSNKVPFSRMDQHSTGLFAMAVASAIALQEHTIEKIKVLHNKRPRLRFSDRTLSV
jgi:hypothetical protein